MALQIAALNDEPFIFVILRTLQLSRYGTLVVLRESWRQLPLAQDCLAGVAVRRTDSAQAEMNPQIIPSRLNCLE